MRYHQRFVGSSAGLVLLLAGSAFGAGAGPAGRSVDPGATSGAGADPSPEAGPVRRPRRRIERHVSETLIRPSDLQYLGAFRLPDRVEGAPEQATWDYGGTALAYRPAGDPAGGPDGFPGSLYSTGLDVECWMTELAIPAPVISRNLDELPVAATLQPFVDVRGTLFNTLTEIPRVGLCVLDTPATGEKLHVSWGQHFQDPGYALLPSHAWTNPTLSGTSMVGAWWVGEQSLYSVNGYMMEIPEGWAATHTGGRRLGTGRFRDGGWSGRGPTLFAIAPWQAGNPPAPGTRLQEVPLLRYSHTRSDPPDETSFRLTGYQNPDEWEGGAFLTTADNRAAVVFVGTKGIGEYYWYGWVNPAGPEIPCVELEAVGDTACFRADGTPCPDDMNRECAGHTSERGWWSSRFVARMLLYDPADLARVAAGTLAAGEPQPYATLDIDDRLLLPNPPVDPASFGTGQQRRYRIGDVAYDRARNHLFVTERFADDARPVVHVWKVR